MFKEFEVKKVLAGRVNQGDDLYESIQSYCVQHQITHAWINALGAVTQLAYFYYDQDQKKYVQARVNEKLEILSCMGNVSLKDGKPFVHLHIVCSDHQGKTIGGHLTPGTKVFACEALLFLLDGKNKLERAFDESTGLHLWDCSAPGHAKG